MDKGKNSGTPHNYLCAFNVKWCSFDLSVIKKIPLEEEELERYKVRKGDLLICEGGDVGRAAIWESDQDIYYQNALHRVRFKDEINQYFYLYVLQYYKSLAEYNIAKSELERCIGINLNSDSNFLGINKNGKKY